MGSANIQDYFKQGATDLLVIPMTPTAVLSKSKSSSLLSIPFLLWLLIFTTGCAQHYINKPITNP